MSRLCLPVTCLIAASCASVSPGAHNGGAAPASAVRGPQPALSGGEWLVVHSRDSLLRAVLDEILGNRCFAAAADAVFASFVDGRHFTTHIGDFDLLAELNRTRSVDGKIRLNVEYGAATLYSLAADSAVHDAAIIVDVERIRASARDDAAARAGLRDAILHEFAHLFPLATSRHLRDRTGDPQPGISAHDHPVIRSENSLRSLLQLPPKDYYGVFLPAERSSSRADDGAMPRYAAATSVQPFGRNSSRNGGCSLSGSSNG
jgi:hypothetical protein